MLFLNYQSTQQQLQQHLQQSQQMSEKQLQTLLRQKLQKSKEESLLQLQQIQHQYQERLEQVQQSLKLIYPNPSSYSSSLLLLSPSVGLNGPWFSTEVLHLVETFLHLNSLLRVCLRDYTFLKQRYENEYCYCRGMSVVRPLEKKGGRSN